MTNYVVPPFHQAIASMLDRESFNLRTGAARPHQVCAQLRVIADCLDPKNEKPS